MKVTTGRKTICITNSKKSVRCCTWKRPCALQLCATVKRIVAIAAKYWNPYKLYTCKGKPRLTSFGRCPSDVVSQQMIQVMRSACFPHRRMKRSVAGAILGACGELYGQIIERAAMENFLISTKTVRSVWRRRWWQTVAMPPLKNSWKQVGEDNNAMDRFTRQSLTLVFLPLSLSSLLSFCWSGHVPFTIVNKKV